MSTPPFSFVAHRPAPPLSRYVDALWHAKGQIGYTRDHILPTGYAVLLVNLGAPIRTVDGKGNDGLQRNSWVCGVHTRAMLNEPQAATHVLGVAFAPHGAHALLGLPLAEVSDRVVSLDALWGRAADELRERVGMASSVAECLRIAEAWLVARLPEPDVSRGLQRALASLSGIPPRSIRELCAEVGISHRHFIDRCRRFAGLPPQQIVRIARLRRTVAAIDPQRPVDWASLAASNGYCDQSHLVREFRRLGGFTPAEYLRRRLAVYGPTLRAGQETAFVPIVGER